MAEQAKTCLMCHQPADSLPLSTSLFSGSWPGIGLGLAIVIGLIWWVTRSQGAFNGVAQVVEPETPTATATITPAPTNTSTPTPSPTLTPVPTPTPRTHVVESGQALVNIALLYGVDVEELKTLNKIEDVRTLRPGQVLIIPESPQAETSTPLLPNLMVYTVKEGDTLSSIAFENGTPMEAIIAANPNINLDLIYPGEEIVVPLSTPTPTLTPTPLPTETPTPGPRYIAPNLLSPANGQMVNGSTLMLTWTSTGLLDKNEFYVVQLSWPNDEKSEYWLKNSSLRLSKAGRPAPGLVIWGVAIKRQSGVSANGAPVGEFLAQPNGVRTFNWQ
jgi:LysM repeat protein